MLLNHENPKPAFHPPFLAAIFAVFTAADCHQHLAIALRHHQHHFCGANDGRERNCGDFGVFPDSVLPDGVHHWLVGRSNGIGGTGLGQG